MLSADEPGSIAAPSRVADSRNKVATCIYQQPVQSDAALASAAPTVWWYCTAVAVVVVAAVFMVLCYVVPGVLALPATPLDDVEAHKSPDSL